MSYQSTKAARWSSHSEAG